MAGDGRERGGIRRLIDRLLGRDRDRRSGSTALFTAHQPPPWGGRPAEIGEPVPDGSSAASTTVPVPEVAPSEPEPQPEPEPEPASGPVAESESLQTSVHEDTLEQVSPRSRQAPGVRVHDEHLEQRSGPVQLTPSQAIELARGGREALRRRDRD